MKLKVAMRDRLESLAKPQTACPLVQPEPRRVPKPTNRPAASKVPYPFETSKLWDANIQAHSGDERSSPKIKTKRQARSRLKGVLDSTAEAKMPHIPMIRPLKAMSMDAASPIKSPPTRELSGVKFNPLISMDTVFDSKKIKRSRLKA